MGDYLIRRLTNQDPDFYSVLGPFLASRQVAKELGVPAWDDPGKVWYVATQDGRVCGFVAALPQSQSTVFCSDYTIPSHRSTGVYAELSSARMCDHADAKAITATVASPAIHMYANLGFTPVGKRGRYTTMKREKDHA